MAAERREEDEEEASEAEGGEESAAVKGPWDEHGTARFRRLEIELARAVLLIHCCLACGKNILTDEGIA